MTEPVFTLAHITDIHWPHVAMPTPTALLNKRIIGICNWVFKRKQQHTIETLNALVDDLKAHPPTHTLISGDLTNLALKNEINEVYEWVNAHFTPETATIIAGNHDAYVPRSLLPFLKKFSEFMGNSQPPRPPCGGAVERSETEGGNLKKENPSSGTSCHLLPQGEKGFPFVRRFGKISIIGLNTAHPTWPFRAVGWLSDAQIEHLHDILKAEHEAGRCRIITIHHPPQHVPCAPHKRLLDGDKLHKVLIETGFEFLLYGHLHEFRHTFLNTTTGTGHCLSVPSASDSYIHGNKGAGYNLMHITQGKNGKWQAQVESRQLDLNNQFNDILETGTMMIHT